MDENSSGRNIKVENRILLFLGIGVIILGIYLSMRQYSRNQTINASKGWQKTTGVVIWSKIEMNVDSEGGASYSSRISYRYRVSGIAYTCGSLIDTSFSRKAVEETLKDLPVGKSISVAYDPADPKECVSEYDRGSNYFGGVLVIGVGLFLTILAFLHMRKIISQKL